LQFYNLQVIPSFTINNPHFFNFYKLCLLAQPQRKCLLLFLITDIHNYVTTLFWLPLKQSNLFILSTKSGFGLHFGRSFLTKSSGHTDICPLLITHSSSERFSSAADRYSRLNAELRSDDSKHCPQSSKQSGGQGDQIGRIFAYWAVAFLGQCFVNYSISPRFRAIVFASVKLCINFDIICFGLHFGPIFPHHIWSPLCVRTHKLITEPILHTITTFTAAPLHNIVIFYKGKGIRCISLKATALGLCDVKIACRYISC
jgi:hypothetical protein